MRKVVLLGLVLVVAVVAGAVAWWHHATQPGYRLRRGQEALARDDLDQAEHYAVLLEAAGARDHAHLLRALILFDDARPAIDAGQPQLAAAPVRRVLDELDQIGDEEEVRLPAAALAGQCFLHLGRLREAERALSFVADHQPDNVDAHRGLAALYYDQGALTLSLRHLEEWARLDPADGRSHRMMGFIYKHLERFADAAPCYQAALERQLGEQFVQEAREDLAECFLRQARPDDALKALQQCDPRLSGTPRFLALRAEALWGSGELAGAREVLDGALAVHAGALDLLRLRARLYRDSNETEAEVKTLTRVLALDPHDYASRLLLAQACERLQRSDEARKHHRLADETRRLIEEIADLNSQAIANPWDGVVRRRLAALYRQVGRPQDAALWERAAQACEGQGLLRNDQ
jgi:tetratricopeptide (TPR) repeat protein